MMTAADLYWAHMEAQGNRDIARVFQLLGPSLRAKYQEGAVEANEQGWTKKTTVEVLEERRKTVVEGRDAAEAKAKSFGELAYEAWWWRRRNRAVGGEVACPWKKMQPAEQGDWERAGLAARAAGQNPEDRAERQLEYHQLLTELDAKLKRIRQLACGSGGR